MPNKNYIEFNNVSFSYDTEEHPEIKALDGITLAIPEGEFVGIVGHNGSGKSTLAKLINGLLVPTEGDVTVMGLNTKSDTDILTIRQNTGMVFQNPDNQTVATIVEEDVAFGPENLGFEPSLIRERVDYALNAVGMYEFKDQQPHQLSGGQKQRVAIAGVLAMQPRCIIFDEATAMLDPQGRSDLIKEMHKLNDEGVTIIHITHYMEEVIDADEIVIVNNGKIYDRGTPREIFSKPDELRELRLGVPAVVELADSLVKNGLDISDDIISAEELVDALCQLK